MDSQCALLALLLQPPHVIINIVILNNRSCFKQVDRFAGAWSRPSRRLSASCGAPGQLQAIGRLGQGA